MAGSIFQHFAINRSILRCINFFCYNNGTWYQIVAKLENFPQYLLKHSLILAFSSFNSKLSLMSRIFITNCNQLLKIISTTHKV